MRTDIIIKVSMILFGIFFIFRVSCLLYKTQNKVFVSFLRWDISLGMGQLLSLKAHLISGERPESHLRTKCHRTMSNQIEKPYAYIHRGSPTTTMYEFRSCLFFQVQFFLLLFIYKFHMTATVDRVLKDEEKTILFCCFFFPTVF